ncbi:MAG: NAD-dependent epimerase/dehydratase family protein [Rhizobiaceae bacterium]
MKDEVILVTGSMGCIGAWVLRHLFDQGVNVIATDLGDDPVRPRLLFSDDEIARINWQRLDVTDTNAVNDTISKNGVNRIIHLAGLQIPFCRANPPLGAAVNVVGTVNMLEAARQNDVRGLSYASSLAALGPPELYTDLPVPDDAQTAPTNLYGVYKVANEETARIYWQDWQIGSVGLRPYNVYGVARDQGMTADIAKAVLAVAADKPFHIRYGGPIALQHASDVANIFIDTARAEYQGATVCNLRNDVIDVQTFVSALSDLYPQAKITCEEDNILPFPADLDDSGLRTILGEVPHTPLEEAIQQDYEKFRELIAEDKIDLTQLEN